MSIIFQIHTQPFYRRMGFSFGDFENAELFYQNAFSLPMHLNLEIEDIDAISDALLNFVGAGV